MTGAPPLRKFTSSASAALLAKAVELSKPESAAMLRDARVKHTRPMRWTSPTPRRPTRPSSRSATIACAWSSSRRGRWLAERLVIGSGPNGLFCAINFAAPGLEGGPRAGAQSGGGVFDESRCTTQPASAPQAGAEQGRRGIRVMAAAAPDVGRPRSCPPLKAIAQARCVERFIAVAARAFVDAQGTAATLPGISGQPVRMQTEMRPRGAI